MILFNGISRGILLFLPVILLVFGGIKNAESKENIKIKLAYQSKIHGNFNIKKFKLNHPIKLSKREIISHLNSLKYTGTFLGDKEEPVFSNDEIKKLIPVLMGAFAKVSPEKIIHIELNGKGGITSGDIFSFRKKINWRFDSIKGETFFQKHDVRRWNVFAWKLIPKKGQLYFRSGSDKGKRLQRNWIVSNMNFSSAEKESEERGDPFDNSGLGTARDINPELEGKLKQLKYLRDKKLIDEEEYKAQQKKLFNDLF